MIKDIEIQQEFNRCMASPYYFATKYLKISGEAYTTPLTEEQFNKRFRELERDLVRLKARRKRG